MKVISAHQNYNICRIIKVTPRDDTFRKENEECWC